MMNIGEYNKFKVVRKTEFGYYLGGGTGRDFENVLLPNNNTENNEFNIDDEVEAFVYRDSKDRPVATLKKPLAAVGELAYLEVKEVSKIGVFLDIGLEKDVLVPFKEQKYKMEEGKRYLVYIYLDKTERIAATTDIDRFLDSESPFKPGDEVKGIAYGFQTNDSVMVAVDNLYKGVILKNEYFSEILPGNEISMRVKRLYEDGKLGLTPRQGKMYERDAISERILEYLQKNDGFMPYNDKSSAEEIRERFATSKNYFKVALGGLMKRGIIEQDERGTRLK